LRRRAIALADRVERAAGLAVQSDQEICIDLVTASESGLLLLHAQDESSGASDRPAITLSERIEPADFLAQGKDEVSQPPSITRSVVNGPVLVKPPTVRNSRAAECGRAQWNTPQLAEVGI
jgi:hypothetical protein